MLKKFIRPHLRSIEEKAKASLLNLDNFISNPPVHIRDMWSNKFSDARTSFGTSDQQRYETGLMVWPDCQEAYTGQ